MVLATRQWAFILNSLNNSVAVIKTDPDGMKIKTYLRHPLLKWVYGIAVNNNGLMLAGRESKSSVILDINQLKLGE